MGDSLLSGFVEAQSQPAAAQLRVRRINIALYENPTEALLLGACFWEMLVLVTCSALTGCLGNGYPYARMHVGSFEVTSRMPGGVVFLISIALWTGILAAAVLWLLRGQDSRPAEPAAPPNGGPAMLFGNLGVSEGPPSVKLTSRRKPYADETYNLASPSVGLGLRRAERLGARMGEAWQ